MGSVASCFSHPPPLLISARASRRMTSSQIHSGTVVAGVIIKQTGGVHDNGGSKIRDTLFGAPSNKGYIRVYIGVPLFWETTNGNHAGDRGQTAHDTLKLIPSTTEPDLSDGQVNVNKHTSSQITLVEKKSEY